MSVLLGLQDKQMVNNEETDWSTNKIGGLPDFITNIKESHYPCCKLCEKSLYLITQIYCPLVHSSYHRTLYVFACVSQQCWNKPESLAVFRCQKLDEEPKVKADINSSKISNDDWGMNDWCQDESDFQNVSSEKELHNEEAANPSVESLNEKMLTWTCDDVPHFVPYHMYVLNESEMKNKSMDYEEKLYKAYIEREGNVLASNATGKKSSKDAEIYEKTKVKHGDKLFYQFKKKIENCPQQCIRYEHAGNPLYLSSLSNVMPNNISNCQYCNGERVFELQLMPHLVSCLHGDSDNDTESSPQFVQGANNDNGQPNLMSFLTNDGRTRVEFGCIYVYTCKMLCWSESEVFREELIVMQADPDDQVVK